MIRLVLQTDGTGQDGNDAVTNVARLSDFLTDGEDDQYCSYSPGVGTCIGEELDGGIAGVHLEKVMNRQYSWLSKCAGSLELSDKDDFEVELFGFSRGAFISRLLADLLNRCGIPKRPEDATELMNLYKKKDWEKNKPFIQIKKHKVSRSLPNMKELIDSDSDSEEENTLNVEKCRFYK